MEQEKQYQSEFEEKYYQKNETPADTMQNKTKQLHITFHNPNTIEDTAKYLTKIIINNLAELEQIKTTKDSL